MDLHGLRKLDVLILVREKICTMFGFRGGLVGQPKFAHCLDL